MNDIDEIMNQLHYSHLNPQMQHLLRQTLQKLLYEEMLHKPLPALTEIILSRSENANSENIKLEYKNRDSKNRDNDRLELFKREYPNREYSHIAYSRYEYSTNKNYLKNLFC